MTMETTLREYMRVNPEGYRLDAAGVIRSPGKFEGETLAAPYFYGLSCEGFSSFDKGRVSVFELDADEKRALGEDARFLYLEESDSGFVTLATGNDPEADIADDPMEEAEDAYSMHTDWTPTASSTPKGKV